MEVSMDIVKVGEIGDMPAKLSINDSSLGEMVNLFIHDNHYRVNISELEKLIKVAKNL